MALTKADLISPKGALTPAMFPGENLDALVDAWLIEAAAKTDMEAAQRLWVYARAYDHILNRVMLEASTERAGRLSASKSDSQLAHWRRQRDRNLRAYADLVVGSVNTGHAPVVPVW